MSFRENQNSSDRSDRSQRALQALKVAITPSRNSLSSHTAPVTPTRPSMRQTLTTSANGLSVSMNSNKTPQVQQKPNTDANGMDLCPWQVPTDPEDNEDENSSSESPRESKSDMQRKASAKSFTNLTTSAKRARMRRSQSSKKVSKSPVPSKSPRTIVQWPKKVVHEAPKTEKNSAGFNEKPRRSLQPMYQSQSVERTDSPKLKKKVKTALGDLEFDLGIEEKCATEGDEREPLFEEGNVDRETNLKELGPVRYSKMSEEDAEKVFEMRKRELLAFLIKLGANPSLVKKKLASKNIGLPKQIDTSNGLGGAAFDRDRVIRSLRGTFQENVSPNRFIVYNTDNDPLWNNNGNRGRFATPNARSKARAASYKMTGKTDPVMKQRRNSAKLEREKEEFTNAAVKKNLAASFNQAIFDGIELSDAKSPVRVKRNRDSQMKSSHQITLEPQDVISETKSPTRGKKNVEKEEKKEVVESITIDLVKLCSDEKKKKKKKKSKKIKKEKDYESEQISEANKAPSENISVNTVWESHEESIAYQKLIETMRQKSKLILGDIDQIDLQIQKMKDDGTGKKGKMQKRGRDEDVPKRKEIIHEIFLENLEEGYAQKMKNTKRSGSYSFTPDAFEVTPKGNKIVRRFAGETERLKTGQDTNRTQVSKSAKTDAGETKGKKTSQHGRQKSKEVEQKTRGNFETVENRRRTEVEQNARGAAKNEAGKTHMNRQNLSPTVRSQKNVTVDNNKQKAMSSEKPSFGADKKPPAIQTQPMTTQANDRNKLLNAFRNPTINETQYVPRKIIEQNLNKSLNATANSAGHHRGAVSSRPNAAMILTNTKKNASSPNMTPTQVPSTAATSKSTVVSKRPVKKGLTMNRSQQSIENDAVSPMNESVDLFDKVKSVKVHKATKSATKSTFSDGVKKILREGSNEDNQLPLNSTKPVKSLPKSPQFTPKVVENNNRPKFEAPSSADLRTKIYNGTLAKTNVSQNGSALDLNKRDLKDIVMDDLRYSAVFASKTEAHAPQKNDILRKKRSASPTHEGNMDRSSKAQGQISSMQDVTDKKAKGNGYDLEHAERLKLLGQTVKIKRETGVNRPYKI